MQKKTYVELNEEGICRLSLFSELAAKVSTFGELLREDADRPAGLSALILNSERQEQDTCFMLLRNPIDRGSMGALNSISTPRRFLREISEKEYFKRCLKGQ